MAKTKKEEVVESTTKQEQPKVDKEVGKLKVKEKPKMKKIKHTEDEVIIVDMTKLPKKEEDTDVKQETTIAVDDKKTPTVEEVIEEAPQEETDVKNEATPVVEEITKEKQEEQEKVDRVAEKIEKTIKTAEETGEPIPESIEKLMDFMEETGGDLEDYVKLNRDVSKLDDQDVLHEYYKQTKPHLNTEEINFMLNDQFEYDEEIDDEKQIKRKKLALKEQVASARAHLDGQKSKYYKDIKAGSKLTPEQQKAIDFFNRYNEESETSQEQQSEFIQKTDEVFNDNFKGFEYSVGEKKFRFNVKDVSQVKDTQSDINNFIKKFLNEKNTMQDAGGYHKSLFTAMNADAIAQHYYEQGKADAVKDSIAKDKNINVGPRQAHGEIETGGLKVKVLGENSSDFKFKIKKKN